MNRDELNQLIDRFLADNPPDEIPDRELRERRFDAGLAFVSFRKGFGGLGVDSSLQPLVEERFREAGCEDHMSRNVIGLGMAAPTIHEHGTDEQRIRHLRPLFSGEDIWCQLFSEPGAGSDLAALATKAVEDGDNYVVNGQKVWTSLGHVARWGLLVARTDPTQPKHKGLTYFICDMSAQGVDVRPLRQLTGDSEFNEVYLNDVVIPKTNMLGSVSQGWQVAMTTLMNERVSLGGRSMQRGEGPIGQAIEAFSDAAAAGRVGAAERDRLMKLWAKAEAARLTNVRAASQEGRVAGPEGSIAKLQMAELNKSIYDMCVDLIGYEGLLVDSYEDQRSAEAAVHGGKIVQKAFLRAMANSIEGGTSEVLRNILGERVLGLPPEPRVDRGIPWNEVKRS